MSRRSFRAPWRLVAVPLAVVALASGAVPAGASPGAETTVFGTVRLLAADTVDPSHRTQDLHQGGGAADVESDHAGSEDVYLPVLQTGGGESLRLTGDAAQDLKPNTSVRVSGTVSGGGMAVASAQVLGAAPVSALPTSGNVRTLVMLASWPGLSPDGVTQASATQQMFGDTNTWYRDASYGAVSMTGDVTPWLSIAGPAGNQCYSDHLAVMQQAKDAAAAAGYSLANYANFVVYFPYAGNLAGSDCGRYSGWAYIGSTGVWINGYMDRRTTVHELGHNYGLFHSHSYLCPGGTVGGTECEFSDYGDDYDAMGSSGYVGNFNASQKSLLGWFAGRSVDLSGGGSTRLIPMEQQSGGVEGAVITVSATRSYWLEYRQPTGADELLPGSATDGVLVHLRDDALLQAAGPYQYSGDTGAALLDVRPSDGVSVWTATLPSGQSWTTPEGVTISVGAVSAAGAAVTVARDVYPPTLPQNVQATAGDGQATVTWDPPASPGGSPIVSYRVSASPGGVEVTVDGSAGSATVTGLTNGNWYSFSVAATNGQASGPAAASGQVWVADDTAPSVTAQSPADNGRLVGVGSAVTATFSEPVLRADGSSFVLRDSSGMAVPATVTYDAPTRAATLTPAANLIARSRYFVELTWGIRDSSYNWLPDTTWSFSTGPGPGISARTPAVSGTGVAVSANVTTQFSVPVTGVSASTVQLRTSTGTLVPAAVSYNSTTRTVTLNPSVDLAADRRYTVTLTGGPAGIRDAVDNPLATTTWSFLTGPSPTVAARTPGSGATRVSVAANVTVRFSEAVRGVSTGTVLLRTSTGKVVPAAVSYNSSTHTVTLNPTPNLGHRARYTVTLIGGAAAIRDGAGNPLATTSWSFTTS